MSEFSPLDFDTIRIPKDKLPQGKNCWHCEYMYLMGKKEFPPYRKGVQGMDLCKAPKSQHEFVQRSLSGEGFANANN